MGRIKKVAKGFIRLSQAGVRAFALALAFMIVGVRAAEALEFINLCPSPPKPNP